MISYFMDNADNIEAVVDTDAEQSVVVSESTHTYGLVKGTRLSLKKITVQKNTEESQKIKRGQRMLFQNAQGYSSCVTLMDIPDEDEHSRSLVGEDLAMELLNASASAFESNFSQYIEYYVNRDLFNTGWEIGLNELGNDIKRKLSLTDETVLSRLQTLCELFDCEMSFRIELKNTRVVKQYIDIHHRLGSDRTDRILYSGVDVVSIRKSENQYNVITAVRDTNHGFDDLELSDGQFYTVKGESVIYDRLAQAEYDYGNTKFNRRYTTGNMSSDGDTSVENYAQALAFLKERNKHEFTAEVDVLFDDDDFEIGDYVTFVDQDYSPPLMLKARILQKEIDELNSRNNKLIIGNVSLLESKISSDLIALQEQIKNGQKNVIRVEKDHAIEGDKVKVWVKVYQNDVEITQEMKPEQFFWRKYDKNGQLMDWQPDVNGSSITDDFLSIDALNDYRVRFFTTDYKYVSARVFLDELSKKASQVMRLQTDKTISLIHISDPHKATDTVIHEDLTNQYENEKHVLNAVEMTNYINFDGLILNGDVSDGGTTSRTIAEQDLQTMIGAVSKSQCPFFATIGNHDQNAWGDSRVVGKSKITKQYGNTKDNWYIHGNLQQQIPPERVVSLMTAPSRAFNIKENPNDRNGYYYYDIPGKKARLIFLNAFDVPFLMDTDGYSKYYLLQVAGYREKQIKWFAEVLKNTPADYQVGLFQHFPFGKRFESPLEYLPYNYELIDGIIDAYVNGKTYNGSYTANPDFKASVSISYTRKGIIAFMMSGHVHYDRITFDQNNIPFVSIMCSVNRPIANRPLGTVNEDAWDAIVWDTEKRHVDMIRFGYGENRSFDY